MYCIYTHAIYLDLCEIYRESRTSNGVRLRKFVNDGDAGSPLWKFKIHLEYDIGLHIIALDSYFKSCR